MWGTSDQPRLPVEVKGHWLWGMGKEFAERPLAALTACGKLGDVVRLRFGPFRIYQLNNPEHIKHVAIAGRRPPIAASRSRSPPT